MKRKIKKYIQEQYDLLFGRSHNEDEKCFDEMKEDLELKKTEFGDVIRKKKRKINILYTLIGVYTVLLIAIFTCCFFNKKQYSGYEVSLYDESIVEAEKYFDKNNTEIIKPCIVIPFNLGIVNVFVAERDETYDCYYQVFFETKPSVEYKLIITISNQEYIYESIGKNILGKIDLQMPIEESTLIYIDYYKSSKLLFSTSYKII